MRIDFSELVIGKLSTTIPNVFDWGPTRISVSVFFFVWIFRLIL